MKTYPLYVKLLLSLCKNSADLEKPSAKKNLLLFGKSSNGLDPPLYFWNPLRNFFLNRILDEPKFLKFLDLGHPPQFFLENVQTNGKKSS